MNARNLPHRFHRHAIRLAALLALLMAAPVAVAQQGVEPDVLEGEWQGTIGPGSIDLGVTVRLDVEGDAVTGSIDIPAQGLEGHPLDVEVGPSGDVSLLMRAVPGEPTFTGAPEGDAWNGTFSQGGGEVPFELRRAADADAADAADAGVLPVQSVATPEAQGFEGTWSGEIMAAELEVVVRLTRGPGDVWSGTIDVPVQGAMDVPLRDVEIGEERARFTIAGIPGEQTFDGELVRGDDGERIEGTFRAYGEESPFFLERRSEQEAAAVGRRPQDPVPPLPYDEVELTYEGPAGTIAGTLVVPEGEGPFPAALLISGSGPQDRDSALAGHRPFLVLADALARVGVATLRADDRGVGGTEGDLSEAELDDLVADALAAVEALRARPEVDPDRVGLIGHSEGGYIAPMVAADEGGDPAFVVLLAAPAVGGMEVLQLQNRLLFEVAGATEEETEAQLDFLAAWGAALEDGDVERARELTRERAHAQFDPVAASQGLSDEEIDTLVEDTVEQNNSVYTRSFVTHQPGPSLSSLDAPTLAVYGRLDTQVPAVQSAGRMSGHLRVAGNDDYEVITLPGLNHLLQPAVSGGIDEYATIDVTLAPEALLVVTRWIEERFVR